MWATRWITFILTMSYLCKAGTLVVVIKSKCCENINVEQEMREAVSNWIPRFEKLYSDQQAHISHW